MEMMVETMMEMMMKMEDGDRWVMMDGYMTLMTMMITITRMVMMMMIMMMIIDKVMYKLTNYS